MDGRGIVRRAGCPWFRAGHTFWSRTVRAAVDGAPPRSQGSDRDMTGLETIESNGAALAYIIRGDANPLATTFVTPHDAAMQVGLVTHAAGHTITRHRHPARASHQGPMVEV